MIYPRRAGVRAHDVAPMAYASTPPSLKRVYHIAKSGDRGVEKCLRPAPLLAMIGPQSVGILRGFGGDSPHNRRFESPPRY